MDSQKWIVFLIFTLHLYAIAIADINFKYEYHECGTSGTYTQNSTYSKNLNRLVSSLSNNINEYGFYNGSIGQGSESASAIVLCRGDVELNVCRSCVRDNAQRILQLCPTQKEAFRWYNICSIYYSDESIIGSLQTTPETVQFTDNSVHNPAQFNQDLTTMLDRLRRQAADDGPFLKYAADSTTGPDQQTIYAYVQCTPDLSVQDCTHCLNTAFTLWNTSNGKNGATVLRPSCFFRYENSTFFGATLINESVSTPPPGKDGNKTSTVIIIVVSVAAGLIMIAICIFIILRKMQKRKADSDTYSDVKEISALESLKYDFITILNATNNFSWKNKVGEGRFGAVYKGILEDRQQVAVKKLSGNLWEGNLEFKNEVALMAKLQHRNLVRLLGYCQEGNEMLLVYEFVPNGSLDNILFGPVKYEWLNWGIRYKIIENIARGLIYLHEDSRLRIIHCNLKTSNVLLDADLTTKIENFDMTRLFASNKTHGSSSGIMGTYGYMAPEYVLGEISVKSDVYSFGVLILEIISGQKITSFHNGEDLLSYAWSHWKSGAASNVIDPMLSGTSTPVHEITKCIHIALLCVQENVADRPKMGEVLQMLSNLSMSLPVPLAPGFNAKSKFQLKMRKAKSYAKTVEETSTINDTNAMESLRYDFITIQNATDNFSAANKIGEGGYSVVYKGKLQNGWEVAVKRSKHSMPGNQDLKNEVALLAQLQHRNLVRLLGSCLEGNEMLLVYEFVPNGSLDQFLFDPIKCGYLDWGRGCKIIENIARGLVYLHEDSRLRIVHRDVKARNILLDVDLNPKIADFDLALLFASDETQGSTDRVVGTYGYIAPEYLMDGQISVRSDVYSFGVLVLEIISGQKRFNFQNGESRTHLISYAWTHWKNGCCSNVIDPMLRGVSSPVDDIIKCIQVALLCVQENVEDRPTMGEVVQMLSNLSMSLPEPPDPVRFHRVNSEASINEMSPSFDSS